MPREEMRVRYPGLENQQLSASDHWPDPLMRSLASNQRWTMIMYRSYRLFL